MENKESEKWSSKTGFILAAIGSAVGLGNIWRYPYTVYDNGGGTFLIPYFIAILTAGIPLLILEYTIGHKYRGTASKAFRQANKKLEILGWLPSFASIVILTYYCTIISWAINYGVKSFSSSWTSDPNAYFFGEFLQLSGGPFEIGSFVLPILLCNFIVWGAVYFICVKEVKGLEKANKVLLPVMLISLIIIFFQSVTLDGAAEGLNTLFTPEWERLGEIKVWRSAYSQVFFSLSLAMGVMIAFSSYLPKKTDINNSALITAFSNSSFEFFAAIIIFSILGFMATAQNVPVTEVVSAGVGLAFVTLPAAINSMPDGIAPVVGVLFFVSLSFAGLTSLISLVEAATAPFIEKFNVSRKKAIAVFCLVLFVLSTIYTTKAGLYVLDIVDYFVNNYALIIIGLTEVIVFGWFVDISSLRTHTNKVSHYAIGVIWEYMIKYLLPVVLGGLLILTFIDDMKKNYADYTNTALLVYGVLVMIAIVVASYVATQEKSKKVEQLEQIEKEEKLEAGGTK